MHRQDQKHTTRLNYHKGIELSCSLAQRRNFIHLFSIRSMLNGVKDTKFIFKFNSQDSIYSDGAVRGFEHAKRGAIDR